jgi:hypothetical protein
MTSASRSLVAALVLAMGGCSVVLGIDNEYVRGGDGAYFAHRDHLVRGIVITSFGAS